MQTLYVVPLFFRNNGNTVAIERHGCSGDDITETVYYDGPRLGDEKVIQVGFSRSPVLLFWADSDKTAVEIIRNHFGKPLSGWSYIRSCRVSQARYEGILAAYQGE